MPPRSHRLLQRFHCLSWQAFVSRPPGELNSLSYSIFRFVCGPQYERQFSHHWQAGLGCCSNVPFLAQPAWSRGVSEAPSGAKLWLAAFAALARWRSLSCCPRYLTASTIPTVSLEQESRFGLSWQNLARKALAPNRPPSAAGASLDKLPAWSFWLRRPQNSSSYLACSSTCRPSLHQHPLVDRSNL